MTNGCSWDGHDDTKTGRGVRRRGVSSSTRRTGSLRKERTLQYALLIYSPGDAERRRTRELHPTLAAVLDRPNVTGWVRLQPAESATTVRLEARKTLLTDGPFVDSKEYLGGLILVDADNLDGALAVAAELQQLDLTVAIEVRPVFEQELGGA
jgi:hypothetical protein